MSGMLVVVVVVVVVLGRVVEVQVVLSRVVQVEEEEEINDVFLCIEPTIQS